MGDLNLGHGFLPRVDRRNHAALERCLSNASPDLLGGEALDLPWVIVEGPFADTAQSVVDRCRAVGTSLLVDTQAWRYREPSTFEVSKFRDASYAPSEPLTATNVAALREYVKRDLAAQSDVGASAYLVPGFIPQDADDDVAALTVEAVATARDFTDIDARPQLAVVGAHRSGLDAAYKLMTELPHHLEGLYLQVTPVDPMHDSAAKLAEVGELMLHAVSEGFVVVAGRLGSIGNPLRAFGVHGADCGLGDGEAFRLRSKLRGHQPAPEGRKDTPMPGGRAYITKLRRSVSKAEWLRVMSVESVRALLLCRLKCCRYVPLETLPTRSREHSLFARTVEATELAQLPPSMRPAEAVRQLEEARSVLIAVNQALRSAKHMPLATDYVENRLAMCGLLGGYGLAT